MLNNYNLVYEIYRYKEIYYLFVIYPVLYTVLRQIDIDIKAGGPMSWPSRLYVILVE